jgi:hypothetical protein
LASDFAGFKRDLVLTILEGFGNFIKHGVSFLFLPTEFQALSFTSPLMTCHEKRIILLHAFPNGTNLKIKKDKCPHQQKLTRAF